MMNKNKRLNIEMLIAKVSIFAIIMFFLMIAMALVFSCGHIRLPNRNHPNCSIPWNERPNCLTSRDCALDFECAHRGGAVGKCTYIDCCQPWRHGPRILNEADWCTDIKKRRLEKE